MKKKIGKDQLDYTHKWWLLCSVVSGFSTDEHVDARDGECSLLFTLEEACVLFLATPHGFFKTIVWPCPAARHNLASGRTGAII